MDEAKSLAHMALSAMLAALILSMVFGLLTLGDMLWKSLDHEDTANYRIREYANYAAYDSKIVRAQDIIQLAEEHFDDIWIMVFDGTKTSGATNDEDIEVDASMSDMVSPTRFTAPAICMFNPDGFTGDYKLKKSDSPDVTAGNYVSNVYPVIQGTLFNMLTNGDNKAVKDFMASSGCGNMLLPTDVTNPTVRGNMYALAASGQYQSLQSLFLNNEKLYRLSRYDDNGDLVEYDCGYYAPFYSTLVYDNDNTTDVVGVIFIRESANVEPESVDE